MSELTKIFDPIAKKWVKKSELIRLVHFAFVVNTKAVPIKLRVVTCEKCQLGNRIIQGQQCRICKKLGLI